MAKQVAILVGPDFEDSEFRIPYDTLKKAGHQVTILSSKKGETLQGKKAKEQIQAEASPAEVSAKQFDALVIPGGYGPDHLRTDPQVVSFVKEFVASGRPVAAVCHGPQLLIEADAVRGLTVTSWPSVRKDLENAGARWVNEPVVVDGQIITSRMPDDLKAFSTAILQRLS